MELYRYNASGKLFSEYVLIDNADRVLQTLYGFVEMFLDLQ